VITVVTAASASLKNMKSLNIFGKVTDIRRWTGLSHELCPAAYRLKDEELARDHEYSLYGGQQLLLNVVTWPI